MISCLYCTCLSSAATRWLCGVLLIVVVARGAARAQSATFPPNPSPPVPTNATESPLRRGVNEYGIWTGYSPFSFVLKGTSTGRQLFLLNLQYARTLLATRPLTLKYTAEAVPVALEIQPTQRYIVDGKLLD